MKKISSPIVFFGSGPVAAKALKSLLKDFTVEAVVTKPPISNSFHNAAPVLELASKEGLQLFTPSDKKQLTELFSKEGFNLKSRVGLVTDYGIIIDQLVIDYFPLGIVNSHFSLLPEWRGADPITFAILSGQPITGVSLMLINKKMDEGAIIAQATYTIDALETTPSLTDRLLAVSHELLVKNLGDYEAGLLKPHPQDSTKPPTYSRKLTKQDGIIDWTKPAIQLEREIRAYVDWPKSVTTLAQKEVIICQAHVIDRSGKAGSVIAEPAHLIVYCGQDALELVRVKPAGKPEMSGQSFLAGYATKLSAEDLVSPSPG